MTQVYNRSFIAPRHEPSLAYERSQAPYYPRATPNLVERKMERGWSPSRSPASASSKTSRVAEEMYPSQAEHQQKALREQLPSLSSLFGNTPHAPPAPSPFSDRPSPIHPLPQDARHPATPVHPDRPFEHNSNSYFHRPAQPSTSSARPETRERPTFPTQPRPATNKPASPRYERRSPFPISTARPQGSPVNLWSPQSQSVRPEHFSRDTSSSFVHHGDHPSGSHRHDEVRSTYREGPHLTAVTPSFPSTPVSTVTSEVATLKDGLGPKIWTGTQFLPRFVRQADVPGEGICYFYDDGTHCKTVIDGEEVNAHWGVTKAGKPRKRLAIACITCREKKIKCDPDFPRCVQCEKFGRICKFKNAPRGGQGSPDTPPAENDEAVSRPSSSSRVDGETFKVYGREISGEPGSPNRAGRRPSPASGEHTAKRQRTSYNHFTPVPSEGSPPPSVREVASPPVAWQESATSMDHDMARQSRVNPYTARPATASELVDVFFQQVPETASSIFPRAAFKSWFKSVGDKSVDDVMLMHSVLALSTVFSPKEEHKPLGAHYAAIARFACEHPRVSMQLVQTRLLLSLYYFATNTPSHAWDVCGSAMRSAGQLNLNVEIEKSAENHLQTFPYGLNRHGYAECRRRTFWASYLMDRFNGFCSGHPTMLQPEDIFLRLPCDAGSFESQLENQNPFFDASTPVVDDPSRTVGAMAYLINLATIWGDVMANHFRSSQRPAPVNSSAFGMFYEAISRRLQIWSSTLPKAQCFSVENVQRMVNCETTYTFLLMHALYHTIQMKLNRYIHRSTLTPVQLAHHRSAAHHHAESLLHIIDELATRRSSLPGSPRGYNTPAMKLSSPLIGYAVVSAVDILTARFPLHSVSRRLASFRSSQAVLAELALLWQSARTQQSLVLKRIRELAELTTESGTSTNFGARAEGQDGLFETRDSMEHAFAKDYDCIYG